MKRSSSDESDQPGHRLAGVDRVEQDPLDAGDHPDRLDHFRRGQGVTGPDPVAERFDRLARDAAASPSSAAVSCASLWTLVSCSCRDRRTLMPTSGIRLLLPTSPVMRPACVPALPLAQTMASSRSREVEGLCENLLGARDVAQRPERVRTAARNDVGLAAERGHLVGHLLHRRGQVGPGGNHRDRLDTEQLEQEVVAARLGVVAVRHPLLDHQPALQAFRDGRGQREPAVVRLHGADGDQGVAALHQGIGHEELEFAGLVAAAGQAEQVVTLDVDVRTAELLRQPLELLDAASTRVCNGAGEIVRGAWDSFGGGPVAGPVYANRGRSKRQAPGVGSGLETRTVTPRHHLRTAVLLAAALVLLVLPTVVDFYTDWLWFGETGYRQVFVTTLATRLGFGFTVFAAVFAALFVNLRIALRLLAGALPGGARGGP